MRPAHLQMVQEAPLTLPGGRPARTPAEVAYVRALQQQAQRRGVLGAATASLTEARKALVVAVAEHGPTHFLVQRARERFTWAQRHTGTCAAAADAAAAAVLQALDSWALEVTTPGGAP